MIATALEDDVVLAKVRVTDDLGFSGERAARCRVVKAADQLACADEVLIAENRHRVVNLINSGIHATFHVAQDFAAFLVDPKEPRGALEANSLEMQQEGMDERGVAMQRPPNRLADPHYPYAARASGQVGLMVVRHTTESTANAASCTRLISAVCPPRGGPSRLVAPTRRVDGPGTTGKVRFAVAASDVWSDLATPPLWSFGDGGTAHGITTQHIYRRPGRYRVRVTARDHVGNTTTTTATIRVTRKR